MSMWMHESKHSNLNYDWSDKTLPIIVTPQKRVRVFLNTNHAIDEFQCLTAYAYAYASLLY